MKNDKEQHKKPEQGILRPPSEKRSLLLRIVRGCPWNRCAFCPAFKEEKFSLRSLDEILEDIEKFAAAGNADTSVFLQDGDALVMPPEKLAEIIFHLKKKLPRVERVTAYSRSSTLAARKPEELKLLRQAGLNRIHVGVESAADEVLELMEKGVTAATQLKGCLNAREANFELCCYFMPGLGGRKFSEIHAHRAAEFIKQVQPAHVRLRTCVVIENTGLEKLWRQGLFQPLDDSATVAEIKKILQGIKDVETELVSDHRINLLLELRGRLPDDYAKLLATIEKFQNLSAEDQKLFIIGRRTGQIRIMAELDQPGIRTKLGKTGKNFEQQIPVPVSLLF